ncbi:MAG: twin-arginine translocase subunit TatC [Chloroflexi bacterium]|nr:twin-arginine translocase subunit TatC [Chloroflexota bacterium]
MANESRMTILEHLSELRARLIICVVTLVLTTFISFAFTDRILRLLIAPAGIKPIFLRPTEMFVTYFRVALLAGMVLAMPVIVYQVLRFTLPALKPNERRYVFLAIPTASVFFVIGILFAQFILLPFALRYLLTFGGDIAEARWAIGEYVSFVTTLLFWSGVIFETPLLLFFLTKLGVVSTAFLSENRKYALLASAVLAAIITPTPDPFNMLLVMVPLCLMYEAGVLLSRFA